ncbi:LOW QUALITY PROTEIN: uncharacterized protein GJ701_001873 [Geothlypis trichas]
MPGYREYLFPDTSFPSRTGVYSISASSVPFQETNSTAASPSCSQTHRAQCIALALVQQPSSWSIPGLPLPTGRAMAIIQQLPASSSITQHHPAASSSSQHHPASSSNIQQLPASPSISQHHPAAPNLPASSSSSQQLPAAPSSSHPAGWEKPCRRRPLCTARKMHKKLEFIRVIIDANKLW